MTLRWWPGRRQANGPAQLPEAATALPDIVWADPAAPPRDGVPCPNCAAADAKPPVLQVAVRPPGRPRQSWWLLRCDACGCRFYDRPDAADYAGDDMLGLGRMSLYLQQGAGLAQLIRPVAEVPRGPGTRLLDVGCGFGFGLDFATRARGWVGRGIDPAQIAALGAARLGLDIEPRLLGAHEPGLVGRFDVVMAAETLEHVPDPPAFLGILTAALAPEGVLILTTPDAAALRPDTPAGQMAGLLSPGLHIVFQSKDSLQRLLRAAGLAHVAVRRDGGALVATASRTALPTAEADVIAVYLDHLEARAGDFAADDDLFWGFAGRAFVEAVNAGDLARAARLRPALQAACRHRFALDLEHPVLPAETALCTLERMAQLVPLNLGAILLADAMRLLACGADRPQQASRLACAAAAAGRLRRAVADLAMAEPMSEEIAWVAQAEALLCRAADPACDLAVAGILALPPAPGGDEPRRAAMLLRVFVGLVHSGRYALARQLAGRLDLFATAPERLGRDGVFCRGILHLQPGGDWPAARASFAWVRGDLDADPGARRSDLYWAALRGEIEAAERLGDRTSAGALRRQAAAARAAGADIPDDLLP